ncbi:MAG: hypothetical protein ACLFU1_08195 [Alphaproteobacteria bacterium]
MAKEEMGSVARTLLAAGSGVSLGLLVDNFDVTPETLGSALMFVEQLIGSLQGFLSVLGIVVAQGWSLYHKMKKSSEISNLRKEVYYND